MFNILPADNMVSSGRWLRALNVAGQTIPAFAAVVPTTADATGTHSVSQATVNGQEVWVNSGLQIDEGGVGQITRDWPALALYDPNSGTPSVGDTWGAGAGKWGLQAGMVGFRIVGVPDTFNNVVEVEPTVIQAGASSLLNSFPLWTNGDGTQLIPIDAPTYTGMCITLPGPGSYMVNVLASAFAGVTVVGDIGESVVATVRGLLVASPAVPAVTPPTFGLITTLPGSLFEILTLTVPLGGTSATGDTGIQATQTKSVTIPVTVTQPTTISFYGWTFQNTTPGFGNGQYPPPGGATDYWYWNNVYIIGTQGPGGQGSVLQQALLTYWQVPTFAVQSTCPPVSGAGSNPISGGSSPISGGSAGSGGGGMGCASPISSEVGVISGVSISGCACAPPASLTFDQVTFSPGNQVWLASAMFCGVTMQLSYTTAGGWQLSSGGSALTFTATPVGTPNCTGGTINAVFNVSMTTSGGCTISFTITF